MSHVTPSGSSHKSAGRVERYALRSCEYLQPLDDVSNGHVNPLTTARHNFSSFDILLSRGRFLFCPRRFLPFLPVLSSRLPVGWASSGFLAGWARACVKHAGRLSAMYCCLIGMSWLRLSTLGGWASSDGAGGGSEDLDATLSAPLEPSPAGGSGSTPVITRRLTVPPI